MARSKTKSPYSSSQPYLRDLDHRGFVEGLTYLDRSSRPVCHYFGGIPYALPPVGPFRWQKPRRLPPCYRYGTRVNPGRFTGGCGVCPQPGAKLPEEASLLWTEDCLQVNVWVPAEEAPKEGWPVLVWYHGGFLQFGDANGEDPRAMFAETDCKVVLVSVAYRLNVFGFLASLELCEASRDVSTNIGFWDQRSGLEWTHQNISCFGGDPSNITIGGYSAGSHSTFHQLAYDLGVPDSKSIVKRALMFSNGPGLQPKSFEEVQDQYNELLDILKIPRDAPPAEKLVKLRTLEPKRLLDAIEKMKLHEFRAVTDGEFVRHGLLDEIDSGVFAKQMKRRGVKLLNGECRDEHFVYGEWKPPQNSYESLARRLQADYPKAAVDSLMPHYFPNKNLPSGWKDWKGAFGRVYADIQIHHLERGLLDGLVRHGAGDLVFRYRIEWRAQCCDERYPKRFGVTHGTDMAIWFWGNGLSLSKKEKDLVRKAFHNDLAKYLKGEEMNWGTKNPMQQRVLTPKGVIVVKDDKKLGEGIRVWKLLKRAGTLGERPLVAKL